MNSLFSILCCIILLSVSACTIDSKILNHSKDSPCVQSCRQHLESCKQACTQDCRRCTAYSNYSSAKNFFKYMREKEIQGGYLYRELNAFRDPLRCRKVSCSCIADHLTCMQSCTGVIQKSLRSVPYCV